MNRPFMKRVWYSIITFSNRLFWGEWRKFSRKCILAFCWDDHRLVTPKEAELGTRCRGFGESFCYFVKSSLSGDTVFKYLVFGFIWLEIENIIKLITTALCTVRTYSKFSAYILTFNAFWFLWMAQCMLVNDELTNLLYNAYFRFNLLDENVSGQNNNK